METLARSATLLHLTGHGQGMEGTRDGLIDLGPLKVGVEELFALRLEGHPLVVLATCDGGLDRSLPDGRSFSLVTPLRSAGASGVLASLWTLDDDKAAEVFVAFYEKLRKGWSPWQALDELRAQLRVTDRHPYSWAGLKLIEPLGAPASQRRYNAPRSWLDSTSWPDPRGSGGFRRGVRAYRFASPLRSSMSI